MTQASIRNGWRNSTARCYLEPARHRKTLQIETNAQAESLILDGKRCTGVRYAVQGEKREAKALREVIVSAGAIASPQLLELSGIGKPEHLKSVGIEVRHALPGVGENLRDHWAPRMKWHVGHHGVTYNETGRGVGAVWQGLKYALTGAGLLGIPASPMRAYFKTREGLSGPDACFTVMPFMVTPQMTLAKQPGLTIVVHQLRPESTGSIHVASANPRQQPAIRFNFLAESIDRDCLVGAMRITRRVFEAPAMQWLGPSEVAPGTHVQTDAQFLDWVAKNAETAYHPVGTCKMGTANDPMAVVDDRLRVRGIDGLRVADASIMPTLTSGNTNAPSIMIGEKCSSMVLEAANAVSVAA